MALNLASVHQTALSLRFLTCVVADGMQKVIRPVLSTVLGTNAWESQEHPRVSQQPRTWRLSAGVELSYITSVLSDPSV